MEHITITYQRERVGDGRRRGRPRGREGLFLSAKKAEADSIMKSHVVVDRTRGHPIETFGAQARPPRLALPRLYNQKQHFRRFPRGRCGRSLARLEGSSPRNPVVWVHGGLEYIQYETHDHQNRPQRSPNAPSGRYLCPQTVTARRAGRLRGKYLGGSGSGEAVEASGRLEGIRQGTRDQSERSTSPDPRGPWTHHLHPGVAAGAGKGMDGGAVGRHAGVLSGFGATRAKM